MHSPPGISYVLQRLVPRFAAPALVVLACYKLLARSHSIALPTWALLLVMLFARPFVFVIQSKYEDYANERKARALGARLLPRVEETWYPIMKKTMHMMETGFPGALWLTMADTYGHAYFLDRMLNRTIVTMEPDHIKALLATEFDSFEKGPTFINQLDAFFGTGVFNTDGEMWKFHRAMTRPFFTRERVSDFEIYDSNSEVAISLAKKRLSEGYPVEFQDLAGRFTLDSGTSFLFGHNVASLQAGIPYPPNDTQKNPPSFVSHSSNIFANAFNKGLYLSAIRTVLGDDWPLLEFFVDKVKPLRKAMDAFTEPMLEEALRNREKNLKDLSDEKESQGQTLLDHLVQHTQDRKILKDELINLLVAGRDTTMCLITFSMYMIAEHPEVERKLRKEIFEVVGRTERPSYANMRDMRYVRAFLNEVLRLYPPVPMNVRRSNRDVVIPSKDPNEKPIFVPKNTPCEYSVVNVHRRADLWGPDVLKFDPDRFIDERIKYMTANPFIFCPFNAGPRICLGQQFAYHEATFFLVRILQQFTDFKLDEKHNIKPPESWKTTGNGTMPTEKVQTLSHLTMFVNGGLWLHMKELAADDLYI